MKNDASKCTCARCGQVFLSRRAKTIHARHHTKLKPEAEEVEDHAV